MILPDSFITRTRSLLGDEYTELEAALQTEAPVSVRINRAKGFAALDAEPVAWCGAGYYLPERIPFTFDPLFHAGAYYVQEASSMFLEQAVKALVSGPVKCLDLCAAPGGKSTHLCSILPEGSLLVCNEVIRSRSHILAENITKWGRPGTMTCCNDPADFGQLTHFFDLIVADLPCSGEGMFRKDMQSAGEWSLPNVNLCAARQRRIIHSVWNALKPGGLLFYSTCTYNTEENEDNIHYIIEELGAEALHIAVPGEWNIGSALKYGNPAYRFYPHRVKGEGFFLAALRKTGEETMPSQVRREKKAPPALPVPQVRHWLQQPDSFRLELLQDRIQAIPLAHYGSYSILSRHLRLTGSGIAVGEVKGKNIIPAHALAMSTALAEGAFETVEVSVEDAIRYLQREALALCTGKGYILLACDGLPLGFAKQAGNRLNNLYPHEWRIRSKKNPERRMLSNFRAKFQIQKHGFSLIS